jgi:hypothetical protein
VKKIEILAMSVFDESMQEASIIKTQEEAIDAISNEM